jgi:hypothetical protein
MTWRRTTLTLRMNDSLSGAIPADSAASVMSFRMA